MRRPVPGATSAQYSLTIRVEIDHRPGMLGKVASAIGDVGGTIGSVDLVSLSGGHTWPNSGLVKNCASSSARRILLASESSMLIRSMLSV